MRFLRNALAMLCKLSKGLFPRLCVRCSEQLLSPKVESWTLTGWAGARPRGGALQLLLLSGTPGIRGWVKLSVLRGVFLPPSHRRCVHNVQRLCQESNPGRGGEVGFYSQGQPDPLTSIPGMFPIKEFCRKLTVSSSPGKEDEGIGSGWWGSLEQRVGDQSCL